MESGQNAPRRILDNDGLNSVRHDSMRIRLLGLLHTHNSLFRIGG